jgi:phosphinothricin tripeptide acetyl hydrolase
MPSAELAAIVQMLRAHPFKPGTPVGDLRAQIDRFGDSFPISDRVEVTGATLGGVPAERLVAGAEGPSVLYLHGGGYVMGSPKSHRHLAARLAEDLAGEVWVLDYRLAPEAPFPAALDDALAAYRDLTVGGARVTLVGDSAGGGLAFATALAARAAGLPAPACVIGISPWVNAGAENESYDTLAAVDPMISRQMVEHFAPLYLGGHPTSEPLISPLFADLRGLPPVLIQIGDRECFFGDAARMHQALIAAGVDAELSVWKEMFHVWHLYWPMLAEGRAAISAIAGFVARHAGR